MKLLIAVFRPEKLTDVKKALYKADIYMMTVIDVRGCGAQHGYPEAYRGIIEEANLHRKVMLLIAVNNSFSTIAVKTLLNSAHTGSIGDGKIFVLPLEEAVRIRTSEKGASAIGGESKEVKK